MRERRERGERGGGRYIRFSHMAVEVVHQSLGSVERVRESQDIPLLRLSLQSKSSQVKEGSKREEGREDLISKLSHHVIPGLLCGSLLIQF
jgi:hypothetical protein